MSENGNPKDFVGASKAPTSTISRRVLHELGLAMLEGECKYWRHSYRAAPVRATVYTDALDRHMSAWLEGQEIDPASGVSHLIKAMACLMIIRDAQLYGSLIDDRPPAQSDPNWLDALNETAKELIDSHAHVTRGAYLEKDRERWPEFSAALARGPIPRAIPFNITINAIGDPSEIAKHVADGLDQAMGQEGLATPSAWVPSPGDVVRITGLNRSGYDNHGQEAMILDPEDSDGERYVRIETGPSAGLHTFYPRSSFVLLRRA
jgi:hypothetical protein